MFSMQSANGCAFICVFNSKILSWSFKVTICPRHVLNCLDVFLFTFSLQFSYIIRMYICIVLTVLSRSHLLACHNWSIICTKSKRYWSNYFSVITFSKYENNRKTKPKPRHFRQFRNPGQEMSSKKKTNGHPMLPFMALYSYLCAAFRPLAKVM